MTETPKDRSAQGEIWWADLPAPTDSGPGFRRRVVVVQCDAFNNSGMATVVCVPLTSNLKWGVSPRAIFHSLVPTENFSVSRNSSWLQISSLHKGL